MKAKTYSAPGGTGKYTVEQANRWCQEHTGMNHMELARWLRPDMHSYSEGYDQFRRRLGGLLMMLMDSEARRTPE